MNEINNLIYASELELEKNNQGANLVGNRPHYPMLLLFNGAFDINSYNSIFTKLGRVWLQSLQHIVRYRYSFQENEVEYTEFEGENISEESVLNAIDKEQQEHDTFESMMQMLIYNVVDTTPLAGAEDFAAHYNFVEHIKELVDCSCKTMLIVLLDDSPTRNRAAKAREIKQYLSENQKYDSVIIISTRTRSNEVFAVSDLYRIVSDIIVLSNNDAVSNIDDEDYRIRYGTLYNRSTYTVSYVLCEKPNQKVAIQINEIAIKSALDYLKNTQTNDLRLWNEKLGIENGKSRVCENFIASLNINIDTEALKYIPVKASAVNQKIQLLNCTYRKFCLHSYNDVVARFSEEYCRRFLFNSIDIRSCVDEFEKQIRENVSPSELIALDDAMLDQIFNMVNTGTLNEELTLTEYIKRQIEINIRENHILPQFKSTIKRLKENSREVIETITNLNLRYQEIIPLNNNDVGTTYRTLTDNYFRGQNGNNSLKAICDPGNKTEDIFREFQKCFTKIVEANQAVFSLPFIEEWEQRLNMAGERIYREISHTLTNRTDDLIRLYGNMPIDKRLTVYMLHTADANGENPTNLFQHLKEAFRHDKNVQFFNTGYDDALEAVSFIACDRNNLLL